MSTTETVVAVGGDASLFDSAGKASTPAMQHGSSTDINSTMSSTAPDSNNASPMAYSKTTTASPSQGTDAEFLIAVIVGVLAGVIIVVAIIVVLYFRIYKRRRQQEHSAATHPASLSELTTSIARSRIPRIVENMYMNDPAQEAGDETAGGANSPGVRPLSTTTDYYASIDSLPEANSHDYSEVMLSSPRPAGAPDTGRGNSIYDTVANGDTEERNPKERSLAKRTASLYVSQTKDPLHSQVITRSLSAEDLRKTSFNPHGRARLLHKRFSALSPKVHIEPKEKVTRNLSAGSSASNHLYDRIQFPGEPPESPSTPVPSSSPFVFKDIAKGTTSAADAGMTYDRANRPYENVQLHHQGLERPSLSHGVPVEPTSAEGPGMTYDRANRPYENVQLHRQGLEKSSLSDVVPIDPERSVKGPVAVEDSMADSSNLYDVIQPLDEPSTEPPEGSPSGHSDGSSDGLSGRPLDGPSDGTPNESSDKPLDGPSDGLSYRRPDGPSDGTLESPSYLQSSAAPVPDGTAGDLYSQIVKLNNTNGPSGEPPESPSPLQSSAAPVPEGTAGDLYSQVVKQKNTDGPSDGPPESPSPLQSSAAPVPEGTTGDIYSQVVKQKNTDGLSDGPPESPSPPQSTVSPVPEDAAGDLYSQVVKPQKAESNSNAMPDIQNTS